MNHKLIVNEIFYSLDGEGRRAGCPAVFVRLAGCNLRCDYCDTKYALEGSEGKEMTIGEILDEVESYECGYVTLTGGEPLMKETGFALLEALDNEGYFVTVETNGSIDITKAQEHASICMDWKIPSSKMEEKMDEGNLKKLREKDVLKIVARSSDLEYIQHFLYTHILRCPVYLSPVYGEIELPELAEFVKWYRGFNKVKMQLQMHKIIWNPNERGV